MDADIIYSNKRRLADLLSKQSKHCAYQELHPWVRGILDDKHSLVGKCESLRWDYMAAHFDFKGRVLMDVGANTGYFSIAAIECGAPLVYAFEGNCAHAEFLREVSILLGISNRLFVHNNYFEFDCQDAPKVDVTLCLNVLHHLGDDFGAQGTTLACAKQEMGLKLRQLAKITQYCWFQMGFNWRGDRYQPLFASGRKVEIVDFVRENCDGAWDIEEISIYDPSADCYRLKCDALLRRFDSVGEFLNRPLFLLKSSIENDL